MTVQDEEREFATTEEQQIAMITAYFQNMLAPDKDSRKTDKPSKIEDHSLLKRSEK